MLRRTKYLVYWLVVALLLALLASAWGGDDDEEFAALTIGDARALPMHTSQGAVERGDLALEEVVKIRPANLEPQTLETAGKHAKLGCRNRQVQFSKNYRRGITELIFGPLSNFCVLSGIGFDDHHVLPEHFP